MGRALGLLSNPASPRISERPSQEIFLHKSLSHSFLWLAHVLWFFFFFLGPVVLSASHVALHALQVHLKLLVPPKPAECWDDRDVPPYSVALSS